ncbi:T9SS type A sorting domain-containing protein [Flavobacterium sp. RHBU_3]|uniref:T9SS type A sorting domain-containing protein n=1 Tax=Flavobacterium sp. RHBU_3 TaxID=3391184 RepID=UPI0039848300
MKTVVLMGLLLAGSISFAQQTVIYSQDFEDLESVAGELWGGIDIDAEDGVSFGLTYSQPILVQLGFTGNVMTSSNFYLDDENNPVVIEDSDNILVSPFIELPDEDNINFSLRICGIATEPESLSSYQVYAIAAEVFDNLSTVNELLIALNSATPQAQASVNGLSSVVNIDLSAYHGQVIYLFVRHSGSTGAGYLFVDDFTITTGELAAVDGNQKPVFTVYPNPVTNVLNLNTAGVAVNKITITDINGRTVKTLVPQVGSEISVDLTGLQTGTYLVAAETDKGRVVKQVIKQ